jgi:hypothetical protein
MLLITKCAVAFFFLFFLHGTSIGNCQQGISYNVSQVYLVAELKVQNFQISNNLNKYKKCQI